MEFEHFSIAWRAPSATSHAETVHRGFIAGG
jgi:hypothetical protein